MPDQLHQSIVESIEAEPHIALELVASAVAWRLPPYARLEVANVAVSESKPVTGAADIVILLRDAADRIAFAIVVEVQLQDDPGKEWAWPKYWALVRERERVPTMVLVIAGDDATARWAKRLVRAGDPHDWHPFVTTLGALPRIVDPEEAAADPIRAVVCALGHVADLEVIAALGEGLVRSSLPERDVSYYLDLILGKAPAGVLELIMQDRKYEYTSEFAKKYFAQGIEQGVEKGIEKGRAEGRRQEARDHVRVVLARRGLALSPAEEARIEACTDLETLNRWHMRAVDARSAADVFVDD